jgi:hypothetical protein
VFRAVLIQAGMGASDAGTMAKLAREATEQTWLSNQALQAMLAAITATYGLGWAARRASVEADTLPSLDRLDLSFHLSWFVVAGLASLAASKMLGGNGQALYVFGLNALLLARGPLFVQGLAVFAGLYRKAGIGRVGRTLGYVFLGITETITPAPVPIGLVSITGLVDLWTNIRKLPRQGEEPPAGPVEETAGRL